ncbi:MAG: hypothetical protein L0H93_16055 [Nocardioides sp.]|nr:hypothetical protein [Nocardioides sp.]
MSGPEPADPGTPQTLHPQLLVAQVHRLDARPLLTALPHVDPIDLPTIRGTFAHWVATSRRGWWSWQEAWNEWTRVTHGRVRFVPARCGTCHGARFDRRRGRVCHDCMGTGKGRHPVTQTVLPVPQPADPPH